jgi:hypothetical protein
MTLNRLAEERANRVLLPVAQVDLAKNEQATQDRKSAIQQELASITPILESAKQAVGQIRSDHLNEIR